MNDPYQPFSDRAGFPAPNSYEQLKREHQRVQITRAFLKAGSYTGVLIGAWLLYRVGKKTYSAYTETRRRLSRVQRILRRIGLA